MKVTLFFFCPYCGREHPRKPFVRAAKRATSADDYKYCDCGTPICLTTTDPDYIISQAHIELINI